MGINLNKHKVLQHGDSFPKDLHCDVCIIGSGAGGGTLAAGLAEAGLSVVMVESGRYQDQADFTMQEDKAFQQLYQDRGLRSTDDLSMVVMQGHCVGGGTTVNWTTCFRTPERILSHWKAVHGVDFTGGVLDPHFTATEQRLNISEWPAALSNPNNQVLRRGVEKLGWEASSLRRNIKGCHNSGYCGMGCPTNAKQGMLRTTIPDALDAGMTLLCDTVAQRIEHQAKRVSTVHCTVRDPASKEHSHQLKIHPTICVSSCGAVNGPALFLRSELDFNGRVGKRAFFHPVVGVAAIMPEPILGWNGAPQSAACHEFIDRGPDKVGFFLEAVPVHPMLTSTTSAGFGANEQNFMQNLHRIALLIALHVDGLLPGQEGGTISLRRDGRINIKYPFNAPIQEAFRASHKVLGKVAFAAGAEEITTLHVHNNSFKNRGELSRLDTMPFGALEHGIFSAQMGGLAMGNDSSLSVVNSNLRHHEIENLYVVDGSVLPTALGVNPSQTIYALAHRARATIIDALSAV